MPRIAIIKGKGVFNGDGVDVNYPIFKLVLMNKNGNSIEIKLDKVAKKLLPYMFEMVEQEGLVEDEQGNKCVLFALEDKQ